MKSKSKIGNKYAEKHGLSKTRLYKIWHSMYCRCNYKSTHGYKNYGGRGIKVCEEWIRIEGFIRFYNWAMSNGYKENLTLDRIDINGNYEPDNCRWITMKEQSNHRRNNRLITFKNKTKTAKEWCDIYNISQTTFNDRLNRGWSIEQALTIPTKGLFRKVYNNEHK